jgi:hypothetical protein
VASTRSTLDQQRSVIWYSTRRLLRHPMADAGLYTYRGFGELCLTVDNCRAVNLSLHRQATSCSVGQFQGPNRTYRTHFTALCMFIHTHWPIMLDCCVNAATPHRSQPARLACQLSCAAANFAQQQHTPDPSSTPKAGWDLSLLVVSQGFADFKGGGWWFQRLC